MLDAERALASAEARVGLISPKAADEIARSCRGERFDPDEIGAAGRAVANPAEPLVRALREQVGGGAAKYVHWGATSQDILDTAAMLVARRSIEVILGELDAVAARCARLAAEHRTTLMAARTLLQQAVPTTFGLKAASWLVGVVEARKRLAGITFAAQLGGAAGTLASLGDKAAVVLRHYCDELDLAEPTVPWHTVRIRIGELGGALDLAAGACAKIALDVVLLAQTEVAEVSTREDGRSSTMPHKRNPASAVIALACQRHAHANAGVLSASLVQEHERAVGAWQAEWAALSGALAYSGGAAAATRAALEALEVDEQRMHDNVRKETLSEQEVFRPAETETPGDPSDYLGSAPAFVDRALDLYQRELG
jgi:3-carboxy-cis,cis-muconate cycloisomerase